MATELFHLPDLPNVGYATEREKRGSDQIMTFLRDTERNRFLLLTIVLEGRAAWCKKAGAVFKAGMDLPSEALDEMYNYMLLMAAKPKDQRALLDAQHNAATWRDIEHDIMPDIEAQRETVRLVQKWL